MLGFTLENCHTKDDQANSPNNSNDNKPGVFFDNERAGLAFPAELVGGVAEVVAGIEEFYVTGKKLPKKF